MPISFRTFDCNFGEERVCPRIGDVVEFSIARDKLLNGKIVAYDITRKSQHGIVDKGVVENINLGRDNEIKGGIIRSYEFRTNTVRFNISDVSTSANGEKISLGTGDEVQYLLVGAGKKLNKGNGKSYNRGTLQAANIELIKAAPKFRTSRQRVNQNLLLARLESGGHKGGMVLSKVAKAPDGTRGFNLKRTVKGSSTGNVALVKEKADAVEESH